MGEEIYSTEASAQLTRTLDMGPISVITGLPPAEVETRVSRFRDGNSQGGSGGRKRQSKDGGGCREGCGRH